MRVVYIDIDSLRPDHLTSYGYEAPTSPHIGKFSEEAIRFDRAYVANSPCMPSRAGLLTGRFGVDNGIVTHGPNGQRLRSPHTKDELPGEPEDWFTLPEVFFENHIKTAAVSSFPRHPAPWFYHVWEEFHHPREPAESERGYREYFQTPRANTVADRAIEVIDSLEEEFFLYVQMWDPHTPYNRTEEQVDRFREGTSLPPYPTSQQIEAHLEWDTYLGAREMPRRVRPGSDRFVSDRDGLRELLALYDAEIRFADYHVGRIIEHLKGSDLYDETLLIITADHGEEFGEKGLYGCHWSVYEGTQRVPLLIKPPGRRGSSPEGREELVTNVDLPPTIVEFADLDVPTRWQGRSLWPLLDGREDVDWRDAVVLDHGLVTAQRAIRTDSWKLIRTYHPGMWRGVLPKYQLFRIDQDPWEQENVIDDHPTVVDALVRQMNDWIDAHKGPWEDPLLRIAREGPTLYENEKEKYAGI